MSKEVNLATSRHQIWIRDRRDLLIWFIVWTSFTIIGIASKAQDPDLPSFSSVQTELFNPWATWCPQTNGAVMGCYGTSWNHIGGPYSILWYWFMIGIGLGGHVSFTQSLFGLNLVFILFLYRYKTRVLFPYMPTSWLFLVGYPQNTPILFLEVLAFWHPIFLIFAVIVKLPFGAPAPIWLYLLTSPQSLRDPGNWTVYAVLITWGVVALTWKRYLRRLSRKFLSIGRL